MDKFTKKKRSEIMSRIRSRNTKFEVGFLKKLSAEVYPRGHRYRKHYSRLIGRPDIVFIRERVAVFLDGDFWHGYNLKKLGKKVPKKYWLPKIKRTILRDKQYTSELRRANWIVLRFWEHEIKKSPDKAIAKIKKFLS